MRLFVVKKKHTHRKKGSILAFPFHIMDCLSTMEQLQFAADTRFHSSCSLLMIDNVAKLYGKETLSV